MRQILRAAFAGMVPDDSLTIRERAVAAWPTAWQGQNLRDILVSLGYDVDTPWRKLAKKDRDWILFTEEQPTVPVYAGFTPAETRAALRRKEPPSYQGTFIGARKHVLHTFATSHSALMKRRAASFMGDAARAKKAFDGAIKLQALPFSLYGRGLAQLRLNDTAAGEQDLAAARKLQPSIGQDVIKEGFEFLDDATRAAVSGS